MAFKSVKSYNDEKYGDAFQLRNDGDYADVIFLYQSVDEVLVGDVHYIKSAGYDGYVHCTGDKRTCPACTKGIRLQPKLFIPLYNITEGKVQFWDRTPRFEPQLQQDVFKNYPNPSEFVFRITRHGVAYSVDTTYSITAVGKNTYKPLGMILAENNISFPDYYSAVCKEFSAAEMANMLSDSARPTGEYVPADGSPAYTATPRGAAPAVESPVVTPPTYSEPPAYVPPVTPAEGTEGTEDTSGAATADDLDEEPEF